MIEDELTQAMFDDIMEVQESGRCNMFEIRCVVRHVRLNETAEWISKNRRAYGELILGKVPDHINTQ